MERWRGRMRVVRHRREKDASYEQHTEKRVEIAD
jgi:hypothetical protein